MKEELRKGFRWVLGHGNNIVATKDPWLKRKRDYCVEQSHRYEGRNELVSSFFTENWKNWNVNLVNDLFLEENARAILATLIPQRDIKDRVLGLVLLMGFTQRELVTITGMKVIFAQETFLNIMGGEKYGI